MKALVCTGDGVRLQERPEPRAAASEVVVDVDLAGICNTDLEIAKGYMGFTGTLGHEVLGRVTEGPDGGAVPEAWRGKRVVTEINCSCLACPTCLHGGRSHCPHRTVLGILNKDGGLADRVAVPTANLHVVPDGMPDDTAVFIEPLAAALHAYDDAPARPGERVCVIGDGKLGLLMAIGLAARAGDLGRAVLVGRHREKLELAERAGLAVVLEKDFDETGFDLVIEGTGHPSGLAKALAIVRPRGTVILKSTYAGAADVDLAPIVINELKIVGSRCGDFARAIEVLNAGKIDPAALISERHPLADAEHAFERAGADGVLKVLVAPER